MPALLKISNNARSKKEDQHTVYPNVLEYTVYFVFHPGAIRQAVSGKSKSAGVDRFADGNRPIYRVRSKSLRLKPI